MSNYTYLVKIRELLQTSVLLFLLGSCASDAFVVHEHLAAVEPESPAVEPELALEEGNSAITSSIRLPVLDIASWPDDAESKWQALGLTDELTNLNVEVMPLNKFVQVALGDVLGLSFIVDPMVQERQDLVTLRVSKPMSMKMLLDTVEQLLAGFDIGLSLEGQTLKVLPSTKVISLPPTFVGPRTRIAMQQGKIMAIVPLKYSSSSEAIKFVRHFLPIGNNASVDSIRRLNALVIIGDAQKVAQFKAMVEMLDQPSMSGRLIQIFRPTYWQAEEIIKLLKIALKTQGVIVAETVDDPGIYLAEVEQLNSVIVAAPDERILAWIDEWITALDTPDVAGDSLRSFVYPVRHGTADQLGGLVAAVLGGFNAVGSGPGSADAESDSVASSASITASDGSGLRMVVDEPHNALIFVGSAQSYKGVYQLLQQIDRPAKQVLLEVTIAELTLEANMQLGVEWQFKSQMGI